MPAPFPPNDTAVVRFRYTKDQPAGKPRPVPAGSPPGTLPVQSPPVAAGTEDTEVFKLDPPAHDIAEVERQWREANPPENEKEWQDARFPDPAANPPAPPPPKEEPDVDAQGVRHRAAGQEVPPTVTRTEDAHPAPTGKGGKGAKVQPGDDGLDDLTVPELQAKAEAEGAKPAGPLKADLVAALRAKRGGTPVAGR